MSDDTDPTANCQTVNIVRRNNNPRQTVSYSIFLFLCIFPSGMNIFATCQDATIIVLGDVREMFVLLTKHYKLATV